MSYTPINWQTGQTITAEKLNKMDNGWSASTTQLFSESVATVYDEGLAWGDFTYRAQITADTLVITFDGTEYICPRIPNEFGDYYGANLDSEDPFIEYPFYFMSDAGGYNLIATQNEGTYTVTVAASSTDVSSDFASAVNEAVQLPDTSMIPLLCVSGETTAIDMETAYNANRLMYFKTATGCYFISYVDALRGTIYFFPEKSGIAVGFSNGIFTVTVN